MLMTIIPGVFALLSVIYIRFYALSKEQLNLIHSELGLISIDDKQTTMKAGENHA